jgi:phage-related protein
LNIINGKWHLLYYITKDGTKPVEEYIRKLSVNERAKILAFVHRPYADLLEDGIYKLRIKLTGEQVRILYFFCYKNIIILTNVFEKHTDKVSKSEIKQAKKNRDDFLSRYTKQKIRSLL